MDKITRKVIINLHTEIDDDGIRETVKESYIGEMTVKGGLYVLLFVDEQHEYGKIRNFITIHDEKKLTVKKSGAINMQQIFFPGKATECLYQHPYGRFLMEIHTKTIKVTPFTKENQKGKVIINYDMLFESNNRQYELTIDFMEVK